MARPTNPAKSTPAPAPAGNVEAVRNAVKSVMQGPEAAAPITVVSMVELSALDTDALVARMKTSATTMASQHLGMGKMLHLLDQKREGGTLSGFVKKHGIPEIDSSAYKCQNAFRMVWPDDVPEVKEGEKTPEFFGFILESDYDLCRLRWLIVVSQILNVLDKEYENDKTFIMECREEVAKVLRARTTQTPEILKGIYDQLRPEKKGKDEETGEKSEETAGDQMPEGTQLPVGPMEITKLLVAKIKEIGEKAMECSDAATIEGTIKNTEALMLEIARAAEAANSLNEVLKLKLDDLAPKTEKAAA